MTRTSTLVSAALAALRAAGQALTLGELAARVDATAEGGAVGLRAALLAENARRDQAGLRAPFVVQYGGEIGLSEWGLSARYRALEAQVQEALAEQRELVRRDLLGRVGDLGDAAFEQVVVMLLERLGHHAVEVVHRQPGSVALTMARDAEAAGPEKIAVVARRSWNPISADTVRRLRDTLVHFEADSGLVLTVGTFAPAARSEAKLDGQAHVRLIDGAGFAALLHDHGIGLASHQPVMRYVDVAFFASLER
ncbi:MAG: restriction endonuclease [Myxococcales bacterium]|nr:restriction endonuclease [Myxococcales bacterium]